MTKYITIYITNKKGMSYMITKKAGCFLINKENKEIALIYRKKTK